MNNLPIINNYAKSLFAISSKNDTLDNDKESLITILEIFTQNSRLYKIFLNPVISLAKEIALLDLLAAKIKPTNHLCSFIKILLKNHRTKLFKAIVAKFIALIDIKQNIIHAKLTTARVIDDKELNEIKLFMDDKYNCKFKFDNLVNANLISGLVLEFDNKILDASVATMIDKLEYLSLKAINNI